MSHTEIDHLVVAADSLDEGAAWCEAILGVAPLPGGQHPLMGTHNRLLNLSSAAFPRCYLEIIAIDPDAPTPGRPRWFGLDQRPPGPPALWHAVVRTTALQPLREGLAQAGVDAGVPIAASRGDLRWQILVRDDGRRLGALPTLIQWDGPHPAERLPDSGLRLRRVQLDGLPAAQREVLQLRGVTGEGEAPARWTVTLDTPRGEVILST